MLDERFRLLVGGRRAQVERHQTMRTTLDWSYELCSSDERIVFDSLSVFPTWFDLQAVRAVAADAAISGLDAVDLLARLVDRSLVEHDVGLDGASRYRLLKTMRAYGREHLLSHAGRSADVGSRHANHVKAVMVVLARADDGVSAWLPKPAHWTPAVGPQVRRRVLWGSVCRRAGQSADKGLTPTSPDAAHARPQPEGSDGCGA